MSACPHCGGEVRIGRPATPFWDRVDRSGGPDACWLWMGPVNRTGYGAAFLNGRARRAHQVAWILTNGEIPAGMGVLHRCDVRRCVNPGHLFLGTAADNVADMIAKGRKVVSRGDANGSRRHPESRERGDSHWTRRLPTRVLRGDRHPNAKVTVAQRTEIAARARSGEKHTALARDYRISPARIGQIVGTNHAP